jgi:hypothetical protein
MCRIQLATKRRLSWVRQHRVVRHAVLVAGEELKRLSKVMTERSMTWEWFKPKPGEESADASDEEEEAVATEEVVVPTTIINNNNNNTNNTTNNNNVFNLSVYLQESCQNAPNLADFIKGITESFSNIDYVNDRATWDYAEKLAQMPYAEGVSKLLSDKLSELTQVDRPIQCTDGKRGAFQIKHMGEWQSGHLDDAVGTPFRNALHGLGQTRVGFAIQWRRQHATLDFGPDHATIMKHVTPGSTQPQIATARKRIVADLSKQTAIDKN